MGNNEKTSARVAKLASAVLRDSKTPKKIKSIATSALIQTSDKSIV